MVPAAFQPWIDESLQILRVILFNPDTDQQLVILAGIGFVILSFGLSNFHYLGSSGTASLLISTFTAAMGIVLLLAAASLILLQLFPWLEVEEFLKPIHNHDREVADVLQMDTKRGIIFSILLGLVFLLVLSPLTAGLFRSNMVVSAASWIMSAAIAGFMVLLGNMAFDMLDDKTPPVLDDMQQITEKFRDRAKEFEMPALPSKPASDQEP